MEEKKRFLSDRISGHKKWILIVLIAAASAAAVVLAAVCLWEYDSYETVSSYVHSRESNDQYIRFSGRIVQYGGDGITCLDADGNGLWSKSYEMEQPLVAFGENYLALADQGGNEIYLFDASGYLLSMETPYPIRQMTVSDSGLTAVVLEMSDACMIVLYDENGDVAAEGQAHLDDNGYPAAIALSSDGSIMGVSYLTVSGGALSSTLAFYDFSDAQSAADGPVTSDEYSGEVIVRLAAIGEKFAAFGDSSVRIYSGGSSPSLYQEIELSEEVCSIVIGDERFALVFEADEEEAAAYTDTLQETQDASGDAEGISETVYAVDIYGAGGTRVTHACFSGAYQDIVFLEDGTLAVLGTDSCRIITGLGRERFSYTFGESICGIFSEGYARYTFVFSDRIETVRLN